jgi:hypothetical protein
MGTHRLSANSTKVVNSQSRRISWRSLTGEPQLRGLRLGLKRTKPPDRYILALEPFDRTTRTIRVCPLYPICARTWNDDVSAHIRLPGCVASIWITLSKKPTIVGRLQPARR